MGTRLVSFIGVAAYFILSSWLALQCGAGTRGQALLAGALALPSLALGLYGGVLIDRWERRTLAQCAELLRAAAAGGLALFASTGELKMWHLFVTTLIIGVGNAITLPCYGALLPAVSVDDRLVRTNAQWQIMTQIGTIAGALIGGVLVDAQGGSALWMPAVAYLGAAALLFLVPAVKPARREAKGGLVAEFRSAFTILKTDRKLLLVTAFSVAPVGFLAAANTLLAPFAQNDLGTDAAGFGVLDSAWGIGALVAGALVSRMFGERNYTNLSKALLLTGLFAVLFALAPGFRSGLAAGVLLGLFLSCANIMFPAFVQRDAPAADLGKILSTVFAASSAVQLFFVAWVGIAGTSVSARVILLVLAVLMTAMGALLHWLIRDPGATSPVTD
ncbi:MFS transporter [Streptomyces sp. NPDC051162]|uniref:MFS transporter n=1 Tax=unclassified Streptomyces TaxID=2593676 RepID=UPI00341F6005